MADIPFFIAFTAGFISFFAPCVVPLVPAFLGFLAGTSIEKASRWNLLGHSFLFVLGFGVIFSMVGVLLNSFLSDVALTAQTWLGRIAGVIIIFFGFYLLGIINPEFLRQEHTFKMHRFNSRVLTSFLFGAAFAVGWTPCVGAVLGSILALAAAMPRDAFMLLFAYSLGLGIPFLIVGFFAQDFVNWVQNNVRFLKYFNTVVGLLIVVLGVLLFTSKLELVALYFSF